MLGLGIGLWSSQSVAAAGGGGGGPVTLNPTSGVNKNSGLTLSNGNLTAVDNTGAGQEFVRALREGASGAVEFEVTINAISSGKFTISVEDGTQDYSTVYGDSQVPGGSVNPTTGYSAIFSGGNMFFVYAGGATGGSTPMTPVVGDKFTFQFNKGAGTVALLYNGTQINTASSLSFTHWNASIGLFGTQATVNFAGPFTYGANAAY